MPSFYATNTTFFPFHDPMETFSALLCLWDEKKKTLQNMTYEMAMSIKKIEDKSYSQNWCRLLLLLLLLGARKFVEQSIFVRVVQLEWIPWIFWRNECQIWIDVHESGVFEFISVRERMRVETTKIGEITVPGLLQLLLQFFCICVKVYMSNFSIGHWMHWPMR